MLLELKLKTIRIEAQKRLNERNSSLYKSMISYIKNSSISFIEKEEVLQQIIDMLLQAQQEGKPAEIIIGNDYEYFCQSIIDEVEESKSTIYRALNFTQGYFIWILVCVGAILMVNTIESGVFNLVITLNQFYIANFVSLILIPFTRKSRQTQVMVPFHPRFSFFKFNINRDSLGLPLSVLFIMTICLKFFLEAILGKDIFTMSFDLSQHLSPIIGIVVVLIAIEGYKRIIN